MSLPPFRPPAERKSKRARKGRAPVTVDSSHTLEQLKLRILEAIDVHPRNAQLFVRCVVCWGKLGAVGWIGVLVTGADGCVML
jgi:hypothetical protein